MSKVLTTATAAAIAFTYRHRYEIADALVIAAFLLKNWPGSVQRLEKPAVVKTRKPSRQ